MVKAFANERKAKELVVNASQRANEIFNLLQSFRISIDSDFNSMNPFDPDMRIDYYSECQYYYEAVELDI